MRKTTQSLTSLLSALALVTLLLGLNACGGGGGGDASFVGAAVISTNAEPKNIDTGDRTLVTTTIRDVHENGILLKFLYPDGLDYVTGTATLTVKKAERSLTPVKNSPGDDGVYLVFYLRQADFGTKGTDEGKLTFELVGADTIVKGKIRADADVHNTDLDHSTEFDIHNPEFSAETATDIEVSSSIASK